jgi:hypothetical protein
VFAAAFSLIYIFVKKECYKITLLVLLNSLLLGSCASKKITDASYLVSSERKHNRGAKDEYFVPKIQSKTSCVDLVHGGYWNSGRKGTYDLLGRNFAQRSSTIIQIIL